ncbi:MAG: hypothetical protein ACLR6J_13790 [Parabacteroides merdae]
MTIRSFRLRRGVLLSIYLIAFLTLLPDLSGWLSTQTSVAGIVGYYSGLLPKETVLTASNEIAASDWKEAGLKVMQVIWAGRSRPVAVQVSGGAVHCFSFTPEM